MLKRLVTRSFCLTVSGPIGGRILYRNFAGYTSRTPVAIVNEDELYEPEVTGEKVNKSPRRRTKSKKQGKGFSKTLENEVPLEGESRFKVLKENDHLISSLMTTVKSKRSRTKHNLVLLEGSRLMVDALEAGIKSKVIFFSRVSDIDSLPIPEGTQLYKVPYRSIQLWSNLTTSPGIMGIFEYPETLDIDPAEDALPLTIICDNVREPGNLGAILRAAAGVGCEKLILMKGCVDLWDPKVLRSASGAHFRVPIHTAQLWADLSATINTETHVFLTDSEGHSTPVSEGETPWTDAGTISKNTKETNNSETESALSSSSKSRDKRLAMRNFLVQFPVAPYYVVDYTRREVVLVVTGETEGLSPEAFELLKERDCTRVNIPLTNGVDSLNTGTAFGIVAFEIRRQFAKKVEEID